MKQITCLSLCLSIWELLRRSTNNKMHYIIVLKDIAFIIRRFLEFHVFQKEVKTFNEILIQSKREGTSYPSNEIPSFGLGRLRHKTCGAPYCESSSTCDPGE